MKYAECPICGGHLDHGEVCDCEKEKENETVQSESSRRGYAYIQKSIFDVEISKNLA